MLFPFGLYQVHVGFRLVAVDGAVPAQSLEDGAEMEGASLTAKGGVSTLTQSYPLRFEADELSKRDVMQPRTLKFGMGADPTDRTLETLGKFLPTLIVP